MSGPSYARYKEELRYPELARAVNEILRRADVVAPVDVFVGMGLLTRRDLESWRHGRIPYLERAIHYNPVRLGRLLRVLWFLARDLNLKPSVTPYTRWGQGPTERLRFTEDDDEEREEAYATHFVWVGKGKPLRADIPEEDESDSAASRKAS